MIILGLGSNLGAREEYIKSAISMLAEHNGITVEAVSSLYETEPVGYTDQPAFLNAVAVIDTCLLPQQLLEVCLSIERELGRVRNIRYGPRTIDIDILFYNDIKMNTDALVLPHPRLTERAFVLIPLTEIAGDKVLYNKVTAQELLHGLKDDKSVVFYKQLSWDREAQVFA